MSKYIHVLIAGHGGVDAEGKYHIQKEGTKQAILPDGRAIYEGEENRRIKDNLLMLCNANGLSDVVDLVPEVEDIALGDRVSRIKKIIADNPQKEVLVWELHNNAFNGQASGTEVFTTRKDNFSDIMATVWVENWKKTSLSKKLNFRADNSDGDPDKEADFYVIRKAEEAGVKGATLIEFCFFDNPKDVDIVFNKGGYKECAQSVLDTILHFEHGIKI